MICLIIGLSFSLTLLSNNSNSPFEESDATPDKLCGYITVLI
jgi:hypothetical protein